MARRLANFRKVNTERGGELNRNDGWFAPSTEAVSQMNNARGPTQPAKKRPNQMSQGPHTATPGSLPSFFL